MKTIDGIKFNTKEDLKSRFFGIENYKPGKPSVKKLFIRMTSGTTGGMPAMFLSSIETRTNLVKYYDRIFSESLLIIMTKNFLLLQWGQFFFNHEADSPRILFLTKKDAEHPLISRVISDFQPKNIRTNVSILNFFTDKLSAGGYSYLLEDIKNLFLGGESLSIALYDKLKKFFPKSNIELVYASTEAHIMGSYCKYLSLKHKEDGFSIYHPTKTSANYVSVVERDEFGVGEIGVHTPILSDYLTGDAGKIIKEKCECGASETLFVYGRINYDIINCVGAVFQASDVEKVFSLLAGYVKDFRLEIRDVFEKGKTLGSLTIKVIPTEKLLSMENGGAYLSEFVKKRLKLTKTRSLSDLVDEGIFLQPEIIFASSFPESEKAVKMKKVDA